MKRAVFVVIMLAVVSLSACGGGGGDATPATQAQKENAQQLFDEIGAMIIEFQHWAESGTVTQYFSSCEWSAGHTSASCNCTDSGALTATGDEESYSMTFTNCNGVSGTVSGSGGGGTAAYSTNGLSNSNCQLLSFEVDVTEEAGCSGTVDGTCGGSLSGTFTSGDNTCLIVWN